MTQAQLTDEGTGPGPFDNASETLAVIAITLMRIYDVQLALLEVSGESTPEGHTTGHFLADKINAAHAVGQVVASLPFLNIGPQAAGPSDPDEDTA